MSKSRVYDTCVYSDFCSPSKHKFVCFSSVVSRGHSSPQFIAVNVKKLVSVQFSRWVYLGINCSVSFKNLQNFFSPSTCFVSFKYQVDSWTTQIWTTQVKLYVFFLFNKYTVGTRYPWVSYPRTQPIPDQKTIFWSVVGNLRVWRANCMHWSTPLAIRDWSICRFCYLQDSWNESPMDTEGWLTFEESLKLSVSFWLLNELAPPIPTLCENQLYTLWLSNTVPIPSQNSRLLTWNICLETYKVIFLHSSFSTPQTCSLSLPHVSNQQPHKLIFKPKAYRSLPIFLLLCLSKFYHTISKIQFNSRISLSLFCTTD